MRKRVRLAFVSLCSLPHCHFVVAHQLNWYRFIGRVLGKALYEGILVEVAFASFFLGKVIARPLLTSCAHLIDLV